MSFNHSIDEMDLDGITDDDVITSGVNSKRPSIVDTPVLSSSSSPSTAIMDLKISSPRLNDTEEYTIVNKQFLSFGVGRATAMNQIDSVLTGRFGKPKPNKDVIKKSEKKSDKKNQAKGGKSNSNTASLPFLPRNESNSDTAANTAST